MNKNNPEIVIKEMETDDEIRGKAHVHHACWHDTYKGLVDDGYLAALTPEKCEQLGYRWRENILVAKDGARVVGFVGYGQSDLAGYGEIFALYVLKEYRGRGIGARLLAAGKERLKAGKYCLWALKENENAICFYEKQGFRKDGCEKFTPSIGAVGIRMVTE